MNSEFDPTELDTLLRVYYKRLFPFSLIHKWLNYGGVQKNYFLHREFSLTLPDDVYLRYQSFVDDDEFQKEIQKNCPVKIDIGAVFTSRPKDHKTAVGFQALEKELVFDIDITDYDDVRSCCSGADICLKCWPLMKIAVLILDKTLKEDFGFKHMLWVYSGRRGIHCWVCDEAARKLSQNLRSAIADYIMVVAGGEKQRKKVFLRSPLHPAIKRASKIIKENFIPVEVEGLDFLSNQSDWERLYNAINDDGLQKRISDVFKQSKLTNTLERWCAVESMIKEDFKKGSGKRYNRYLVKEIRFQYCYPRLDANVSIGLNHLLKSPFCVHPKTGRICIPFDVEKLDKFDPFQVPTVSQLVEEINQFDSNTATDTASQLTKIFDYKKTSLVESIGVFKKFLQNIEPEWHSERMIKEDQKLEF